MFEDKELIVNRTETKLLYDIRGLLIEQNELLKSVLNLSKPSVDIKEKDEKIKCKYCGGYHDNKGQYMACARKYKKDGVGK